jgi:hypothetical protein
MSSSEFVSLRTYCVETLTESLIVVVSVTLLRVGKLEVVNESASVLRGTEGILVASAKVLVSLAVVTLKSAFELVVEISSVRPVNVVFSVELTTSLSV